MMKDHPLVLARPSIDQHQELLRRLRHRSRRNIEIPQIHGQHQNSFEPLRPV
jgi:hypothetical protein